MTVNDFIKKYFDVPNTGDTPQNMGQCVGLIEKWIDSLSLPHVWGNAKDLLANADPKSYDIIHNTPDGVPSYGDIFVFGSNYGAGAGHTGIVVAADANIVTLFEENDGINGGTPQFKTYTYGGENDALGWLHPKGVVVDDQSLIDSLRKERDNNWNLYQTTLTQLKDCQTKVVNPMEIPVEVTSPQSISGTEGTSSATSTTTINIPVTTSQTTTSQKPQNKPYLLGRLVVLVKNIWIFIFGK